MTHRGITGRQRINDLLDDQWDAELKKIDGDQRDKTAYQTKPVVFELVCQE